MAVPVSVTKTSSSQASPGRAIQRQPGVSRGAPGAAATAATTTTTTTNDNNNHETNNDNNDDNYDKRPEERLVRFQVARVSQKEPGLPVR